MKVGGNLERMFTPREHVLRFSISADRHGRHLARRIRQVDFGECPVPDCLAVGRVGQGTRQSSKDAARLSLYLEVRRDACSNCERCTGEVVIVVVCVDVVVLATDVFDIELRAQVRAVLVEQRTIDPGVTV